MAEPWIRVHAKLADKAIVWRAVDALGISKHEAMGLMVEFWGSVAGQGKRGDLTGALDAQIEAMAGWKRKRGKFAAFIRATHLDADGRIREWDEYAGRLDDRRERSESPDGKSTYIYYAVDGDHCKIGWSGNPWARVGELRTARPGIVLAAVERGTRDLERSRHTEFEHARLEREWFRLTAELATHIRSIAVVDRSSERSGVRSTSRSERSTTALTTETPTEVTTNSPTVARAHAYARVDEYETVRDVTSSSSSSPPTAESAISARFHTALDRDALASVLRVSPNPATWLAEIQASLDGMAGHAALSPDQVGEALRDYLGNGATANPSFKHFRGYLRNAGERTAARPARPTHPLGNAGAQTYANARAALEDEP